jgi:hypothetical protein
MNEENWNRLTGNFEVANELCKLAQDLSSSEDYHAMPAILSRINTRMNSVAEAIELISEDLNDEEEPIYANDEDEDEEDDEDLEEPRPDHLTR